MRHPAGVLAAHRLWILGLAILLLLLFVLIARPAEEAGTFSPGDVSEAQSSIAPGTYRYRRPDGGLATTTYLGPQRYFKVLEYDGVRELAEGAFGGDTYSVYYLEQHIINGVHDAEPADLAAEFRLLDPVFLRALRRGAVDEAGLIYEAAPPPDDYPAEALPVPSTLVVGQGEDADRWRLLDYYPSVHPSPEEIIAGLVADGFGVTVDASGLVRPEPDALS